MSIFGITQTAINSASSTENKANTELQHKSEETPVTDVKEKSVETEYPFVLKPDTTILPSYHQVGRGDKGVMEDFFFDYLVRAFPESANNSVAIKADEYNLTPDLAIIDVEKGLFIGIEIDEPYSISDNGSLIPIHVIGSDNSRDDYFTKRGWTVIRFAEEQIAKHPQLCVEAIRHFINTGQLSDIVRVRRWTFDEANLMIERTYRNSYLPFAFMGIKVGAIKSSASYRSFEIAGFTKREKSGIEYVQINLKYPRTTTDSDEIISTGGYPTICWVDSNVFWSKVRTSKLGKIIDKYDLYHLYQWFGLFSTKHGPLMLECYGKQKEDFFYIADNRFDIIFPSLFLKNFKIYHLEIINGERTKAGLPKLT